MSNPKQQYMFVVETDHHSSEVLGTGFHIENGHLVIQDGGAPVAGFAPGRWIEVIRRRPVVSELAAEVGRVAAQAAHDLFDQLGIEEN